VKWCQKSVISEVLKINLQIYVPVYGLAVTISGQV